MTNGETSSGRQESKARPGEGFHDEDQVHPEADPEN